MLLRAVTTPLILIGVGLVYGLIAAALFRSRRRRGKHGPPTVSELLDGEHATLLAGFFGVVLGPLLVVAGVAWLIGVALS